MKHDTIHAVNYIKCIKGCSLCGDETESRIYWVGDMYSVETYCIGDEPEIEYFVHYADALAYAEEV